MKALPTSAAFTLLLASVVAQPAEPAREAQPAPKPDSRKAAAPPQAPASDALAAMVRFRGKPGKPATNVMTATRSGDLPDLKVAALAPAVDGITHSATPRLWWMQSHDTRGGELEFVLTDMRPSGPVELLRSDVPPMKAGYNFINLANPLANPQGHKLEAGRDYRWTINLRSDRGAKPVFCRLMRVEPPDPQPAADPADTIRVLSEAGNWYELFDFAALKARSDDPAWIAARDSFVASIGLDDALKP